MHQDYPYFPHERKSMVAATLFFDDAPIEKGCIRVVPGSHKLGPLAHQESGGWHLPFEEYPIESAVGCPAKAGDVLFFSYFTIFRSGINRSSTEPPTIFFPMRGPQNFPTNQTPQPRAEGIRMLAF